MDQLLFIYSCQASAPVLVSAVKSGTTSPKLIPLPIAFSNSDPTEEAQLKEAREKTCLGSTLPSHDGGKLPFIGDKDPLHSSA